MERRVQPSTKQLHESLQQHQRVVEVLRASRSWRGEVRFNRLPTETYGPAEASASLGYDERLLDLSHRVVESEIGRPASDNISRSEAEPEEHEPQEYREEARRLEMIVREQSKELTRLTLRLTRSAEFLARLRERIVPVIRDGEPSASLAKTVINQIDGYRTQADSWQVFERQFQQLDQQFIHSLVELHPELTPTEVKICSMIRINLSNKEIASLLSIAARTVDTHRTRIRKKLGLKNDVNLTMALAVI